MMLQWLFRDKLVDDDREPILTVELNGVTWGILLPRIAFWIQLASLMGILSMYGMMTSAMVYHWIVKKITKKTTSWFSYFVGYGIILPTTLTLPPMLMRKLDLENIILRFCLTCVLPALVLFRTSEAMYGYAPKHATVSFPRYAFYFSTTLPYAYDDDGKIQNISIQKSISTLRKFGWYFLLLSLYQSIFGPTYYEPITSCDIDSNRTWRLWNSNCSIFQVTINNAVGAGLIQLYLSTFCYGVGIITMMATQIEFDVDRAMMNPLLTATSPSDFWGRKWNLIVHKVLKNGVYKPVYKYTSKQSMAVISCFLASGLFHEWILWCIYRCNNDSDVVDENSSASGVCRSTFTPTYGKQTAFFLWNALVVSIESLFLRSISTTPAIPSYVKTFLTLLTAMPLAHWFLHSYTKSECHFVQHSKIGFLIIQQVHPTPK